MFLIFLEGVKITSVGLKLERPQLQHWLLFLEHNRLRPKDLNVVAGLPVPVDYDCVYDSVFNHVQSFQPRELTNQRATFSFIMF